MREVGGRHSKSAVGNDMALDQRNIRFGMGDGTGVPGVDGRREASLGELFGQLSNDATRLIRQEVTLAKSELRETGSRLARDGARLAAAAGLALMAALAATAFLIIALGDLFDNYWLSALVVTLLFGAIAAALGKSAMADIRSAGIRPEATLETLREDREWAKREAQGLKRDLTAPANP